MMNLMEASKLLNTLVSQTDNKSEKKVYNCFIRTLSALEKKELSENQLQLLDNKLSDMDLLSATGNKKKYYQQRLSKFRAFLKNEFSFTTEKYYTEHGMIFGMSIGVGLGLSIGTAINPSLGPSIGLSSGIAIGMIIGMLNGARKDKEAKKQGRVI